MRNEEIKLPWSEWEVEGELGKGGFGSVYRIRRNVYGVQKQLKNFMKFVKFWSITVLEITGKQNSILLYM